jgi:hypothetical protein
MKNPSFEEEHVALEDEVAISFFPVSSRKMPPVN